MKAKIVLLVMFLIALAPPIRAASTPEPGLDGTWTGEVPRGGGRVIPAEFEFHVKNGTLTGVVHAVDETFNIEDGKIDGTHVTFRVAGTIGDYSGDLDGDTLKMKVKYSGGETGRVTLDFLLKRVNDQMEASAPTASVDGIWKGDIPRSGGMVIPAEFEFHTKGGSLTGVVRAIEQTGGIEQGKINGLHVAFRIEGTNGDFSGDLDGDTLKMKVRYSGGETGRVTLDFVLERSTDPTE